MARFSHNHQKKKKNGNLIFAICVVIYAIVFILAASIFFNWLWTAVSDYELSRPEKAVDAYMAQLTKEHIVDSCTELFEKIDPNIQTREDCEAVIIQNLNGKITCSRKSSESTETRQVYAIRCGAKLIGSFTIVSSKDNHTPWRVEEEKFDFTFLLSEPMRIDAPEGYPVYVNSVQLDESYVTGEELIPYTVLRGFYDDYFLPQFKKLTYEVGPLLGRFEMRVTDLSGKPFTLDENTDLNAFIPQCSDAEIRELDTFVDTFLYWYVVYKGCANDSVMTNYAQISQYVLPGSDLDNRLKGAMDGLTYAQSRGDQLVDITKHHFIRLSETDYMVDLTYLVDTTGFDGVVQTTNNAKLIITRINGQLKATAEK